MKKHGKLTTDISDNNWNILDDMKSKHQIPYGNTVNTAINIACNAPTEVQRDVLDFYKSKIKLIYTQMDSAGEFERSKLMLTAQYYITAAKYLNHGNDIELNKLNSTPSIRKVMLKNGCIYFPDNWIVLNENEALNYSYAGVVEVKPGQINTTRFPHFLFFTDKPVVADYDDAFRKRINEKCCDKYADFKIALSEEIDLIADPTNPGEYLNWQEHLDAPCIGLFSIFIKGDPNYPRDYQPPFGTYIERNSNKEV